MTGWDVFKFGAEFWFSADNERVARAVNRDWLHELRMGHVHVTDAALVQRSPGIWCATVDGETSETQDTPLHPVRKAYTAATVGVGADPLKFWQQTP